MRRWLFIGMVVGMAVDLIHVATYEPPPKPAHALLPAFADVDRDFAASLAATRKGALRAVAQPHGAKAARALFFNLVEQHRNPPEQVTWSTTPPFNDHKRRVRADVIRELADDRLRDELMRALGIRTFHPDFRRTVAFALCADPATPHSAKTLVGRLVDRHESNDFRRWLLMRLPRLGGEAPKALRALLYLPFDEIDITAAGTLARMGDPEAPSLVLAGLRFQAHRLGDGDAWHLAEAAKRLTGRSHPFEPKYSTNEADARRRVRPHIEALERWMRTAPRTMFERVPRARLTLATFDDVVAAGDDVPLAEAVMLALGLDDQTRLVHLQRLENLAWSIRTRSGGSTRVETRLAAIANHCLTRHRSSSAYVMQTGRDSLIHYVLREDSGNCIGYSTLYLELGHRLGWPLHGVYSPFHCFVRYDDGATRQNVETTALGVAFTDGHYFKEPGTSFLKNQSRRQILAGVLSNYASTLSNAGRYEKSVQFAERALLLDDGHYLAHLNLASSLFQLGEKNRDRVLAAMRRYIELWPTNSSAYERRGLMKLRYRDLHGALADFKRALELAPAQMEARAWCAIAEARLGNVKGSLARARPALKEKPDHFLLRVAESEALLRRKGTNVQQRVAAMAEATGDHDGSHLEVTRILLDCGRPRHAGPVLGKVKRERHEYWLLMARLHHALGDTELARKALTNAERNERPGFEYRRLERLIR